MLAKHLKPEITKYFMKGKENEKIPTRVQYLISTSVLFIRSYLSWHKILLFSFGELENKFKVDGKVDEISKHP